MAMVRQGRTVLLGKMGQRVGPVSELSHSQMSMSKNTDRKWDSNLKTILKVPVQISHLETEISQENECKKESTLGMGHEMV